jgi:hypothetical protein
VLNQQTLVQMRNKERFGAFFDGLELVEPGVTVISDWRPETAERPDPAEVACLGAVGRIS